MSMGLVIVERKIELLTVLCICFSSITVTDKPHIIDSPSITVNENERVVLTKEIVSNPLSNVSWYDGSELLLTQYAVRTATFIIQKATCTDTKNFTLIASNTVEGNVSALMEVKVNCKPQSYKTNFTLGVTDTTGIDFSTFVIAYPEPSIKLEYENGSVSDQMMKSISRNAVNNFTIHISQAVLNQSNFGVYRLKVWNSFGEVTMIVNVIPQRKPNSPGNVEIFCEKTSANVQWKSSFNGGDPQLFTIFASNGQQFESELISDRGENEIHSAFIQNLQPSTTYVFYVSAQNSHGLISSERINCTTLKESSNNLPVITGSVAAGGITLAIVVIAVVVVFRRFKKSGSQASNNRIRANEDASHYTTLAERNEHSERNVYDILSQNEGANQYEAYLMKESQETKSQMYESLQKTEVSDKRNICDKQMIAKYTKGGIKLTVSPSNDVEVNQTVTLRCELDPNPTPPITVSFEINYIAKLCLLEHRNGKCITSPDTCVTGYNASCHNETLYSLQVSVPWNWNGASIYCQSLFSKSELVVFDVKVPVTSVTLTPTPIIALVGQQINITCTTSYCYPPAYVTWYMSSTDITSLSTATKDETEDFVRTVSSLSINLGKSDNGKHVFCSARNILDQSVTSMMNTVTVLFKPEVTSYSLNPYIVIEGHRATLKCAMIAANPNTSIIWRWSRTDRPKDVLYYGPNYTIPNIQRNRSGTYNCTASNSIGTSEPVIINVDVQYKPEVISNSPSQSKVIEGNTVTLECILIGANPNTNIMWRWFRTEYPNNILYNGPIYTIFNIQRDMYGPYSCTASNFVGTSKVVTIYVDELYKPKIADTPTTIVNESDRAILSREIVSNPLSNASWYDGSVLLMSIQTTVTTATYIIEKATCTDTQNFTLIASNTVERNVSALVELIVHCKPHLFKRNITLGVSDATGIAFSITVIAYPEPLYELRYDNGTRNTRMVGSICRSAVNNFTIHFKQTVVEQDDYGIYHLLVSNAFGESIVILNVLPQRKPEDPTILKIVCEETRAKVQWKPSFNGGNTQTFTVTATYGQYQKFESNMIYDKGENIIHSAYSQNLQPSTRYVLCVSAQNRHGSSSSENATCTTLTEHPRSFSIITGSAAAGGITLAIVVIVVVVFLRRFKKRDNHERNNDRNDPMRTNEDASHYTTLGDRQENGQMYESLKNAVNTENRNICDKQMNDKNPKDLSEIYVNHSVKANNTEYINLSFST